MEATETRVKEKYDSITRLYEKLQSDGDAAQQASALSLFNNATMDKTSSDRRRALRELTKIEAQLRALSQPR